jgi:methyl-accepting chemotaxis protein
MLTTLSLRTKILMIWGTSLTVLLITALAFFGFLIKHTHDYKTLTVKAVDASNYISQISLSYTAAQGSPEHFAAEQKNVQHYLSELDKLNLDISIQDQLSKLRSNHNALSEQLRSPAYDMSSRAEEIAQDGKQQINILLNNLSESAHQKIESTDSQLNRTYLSGSLFLIGFTLLILFISLWWLSTQLMTPLSHITRCLVELSKGNFAERINTRRHDELGELASASNALSDFLSETFASLSKNTRSLDQASDDLNTIASQMGRGVEEQGLRTDQVAAAMEEMTAAAQEVAGHTVRASEAADDAERATQQGEQAMISLVNSIINTRDEISKTTEVILQLEDDSSRISEVLAVIHSIAEQTNLLALNAAIEAARAGESGRGFAVVADEVRNLAQRTAQSTAEINVIITAVQRGAESAVKAIEGGKQSSIKGVEQVHQAGEILSGVTSSVVTIRDMSMQIATAAEEQTLVAEDISRNLTDLVGIASNNQENVRRTEQSSNTLRGISKSISQVTEHQHR